MFLSIFGAFRPNFSSVNFCREWTGYYTVYTRFSATQSSPLPTFCLIISFVPSHGLLVFLFLFGGGDPAAAADSSARGPTNTAAGHRLAPQRAAKGGRHRHHFYHATRQLANFTRWCERNPRILQFSRGKDQRLERGARGKQRVLPLRRAGRAGEAAALWSLRPVPFLRSNGKGLPSVWNNCAGQRAVVSGGAQSIGGTLGTLLNLNCGRNAKCQTAVPVWELPQWK